MGTDITPLKLLAAILAFANLYRGQDGHWVLAIDSATSKGSKLDKVAGELLTRDLIQSTTRGRYVVSSSGMERITDMLAQKERAGQP